MPYRCYKQRHVPKAKDANLRGVMVVEEGVTKRTENNEYHPFTYLSVTPCPPSTHSRLSVYVHHLQWAASAARSPHNAVSDTPIIHTFSSWHISLSSQKPRGKTVYLSHTKSIGQLSDVSMFAEYIPRYASNIFSLTKP